MKTYLNSGNHFCNLTRNVKNEVTRTEICTKIKEKDV